jgi:hypothetical protein
MDIGDGETPRGFQDYVDAIAVAGLVLGGLLVSVCGPLLRKRNETLRGELAAAAELGAVDDVPDHRGELIDEQPAAAYLNGDQAAAAELADRPGG